MKMHSRMIGSKGSIVGDVPADQWEPAIRKLKPLRVYTNKSHFMVVQRQDETMEAGVVVLNPMSSESYPGLEAETLNKQGWTAKQETDGLIHYSRGTTTTTAPSP